MVKVIGIDPGTLSVDLCGLEDGRVWLDQAVPTAEALADPGEFVDRLAALGPVDLIAGPSGYGLPMLPAAKCTAEDLRLAYLSGPGERGGIGGLRRLAEKLVVSTLPVMFTPGVIHLPTVPPHRKTNRVDLGTAEKVAAAALAIWDQSRRQGIAPPEASFILLELGGAFTAVLAVDQGQIVDGLGGSSGPIGWRSPGAWDGEVAFLAERIEKEMLFAGGAGEGPDAGDLDAFVEGAVKGVLALTASVPRPREILLSGRHSQVPRIRQNLVDRLGTIAPVSQLRGFARTAKEGAQGAALIADGLSGGTCAGLVETMRLRDASGTTLDYLKVISVSQARRRLGLT